MSFKWTKLLDMYKIFVNLSTQIKMAVEPETITIFSPIKENVATKWVKSLIYSSIHPSINYY